ncbi:MAG: hypothetical protein ACYTDY_16330 [Planctomycetota bacterium]
MRARVAILTLLLAGCGANGEEAAERVHLILPGAEPREPLRLDAPPGLGQSARFTLSGRYSVAADGAEAASQELRSLLVDLSAIVQDRGADGEMLVDLSFDDVSESGVEATKLPGGGPGWLSPELAGTSSRILVSPRGGVLAGGAAVTEGPFVLFVPLPEEPVGVGARWEIRRRPRSRGLPFTETTTFTLLSRDGVRAEVGIDIRQSLEAPARIAGPDGREILEWESRGTGRADLRLDAVLIDRATLDWRMTSTQILRGGAESAEVTTRIECDVRLAPR